MDPVQNHQDGNFQSGSQSHYPIIVRFTIHAHAITFQTCAPTDEITLSIQHKERTSEGHRITLADANRKRTVKSQCSESISFEIPSQNPIQLDLPILSKGPLPSCSVEKGPTEPAVNPKPLAKFNPTRTCLSIRDAVLPEFVHDCAYFDLSPFVGGVWSIYRDVDISLSLGAIVSMSVETCFIDANGNAYPLCESLNRSLHQCNQMPTLAIKPSDRTTNSSPPQSDALHKSLLIDGRKSTNTTNTPTNPLPHDYFPDSRTTQPTQKENEQALHAMNGGNSSAAPTKGHSITNEEHVANRIHQKKDHQDPYLEQQPGISNTTALRRRGSSESVLKSSNVNENHKLQFSEEKPFSANDNLALVSVPDTRAYVTPDEHMVANVQRDGGSVIPQGSITLEPGELLSQAETNGCDSKQHVSSEEQMGLIVGAKQATCTTAVEIAEKSDSENPLNNLSPAADVSVTSSVVNCAKKGSKALSSELQGPLHCHTPNELPQTECLADKSVTKHDSTKKSSTSEEDPETGHSYKNENAHSPGIVKQLREDVALQMDDSVPDATLAKEFNEPNPSQRLISNGKNELVPTEADEEGLDAKSEITSDIPESGLDAGNDYVATDLLSNLRNEESVDQRREHVIPDENEDSGLKGEKVVDGIDDQCEGDSTLITQKNGSGDGTEEGSGEMHPPNGMEIDDIDGRSEQTTTANIHGADRQAFDDDDNEENLQTGVDHDNDEGKGQTNVEGNDSTNDAISDNEISGNGLDNGTSKSVDEGKPSVLHTSEEEKLVLDNTIHSKNNEEDTNKTNAGFSKELGDKSQSTPNSNEKSGFNGTPSGKDRKTDDQDTDEYSSSSSSSGSSFSSSKNENLSTESSEGLSTEGSERSIRKRRSLWIEDDSSDSEGDSERGAAIARRLRGKPVEETTESDDSEDDMAIVRRMRKASSRLEEDAEDSDRSDGTNGVSTTSRMREELGRQGDIDSNNSEESETFKTSGSKGMDDGHILSETKSHNDSLNLASVVSSNAPELSSASCPESFDSQRSLKDTTSATSSCSETKNGEGGIAHGRSKSKSKLRRLKSRKRGTSSPMPILTNERYGESHVTVHMHGKHSETPVFMDLPTKVPLIFWMINGPNEPSESEVTGEESENEKLSTKRNQQFDKFGSRRPGPKARIGLISPLQKTVMSMITQPKEPDYIEFVQPISFKRTATRQIAGYHDERALFEQGEDHFGKFGSGWDEWNHNGEERDTEVTEEKNLDSNTAEIACLTGDVSRGDEQGESLPKYELSETRTGQSGCVEGYVDKSSRDLAEDESMEASGTDGAMEKAGLMCNTASDKDEVSMVEEDTDESSLTKRRRYDSHSTSGSSDEEWRNEEGQKKDGGPAVVCRRASYDTVVNRAISEIVHNFRPNRYVKGVSKAVREWGEDERDRESDESEEERLFREAVTAERGVTQKRLSMSEVMMADLALELENVKHEHAKAIEYMECRNSKTEDELVRWIERLEEEKTALLEMVNAKEGGNTAMEERASEDEGGKIKQEEQEETAKEQKELRIVKRENERLLRVILRLKQELDMQTGSVSESVENLREITQLNKMVQIERAERHRLEKLIEEMDVRGGMSTGSSPQAESPSILSPSFRSPSVQSESITSPSVQSPSVRSHSPSAIDRVRNILFG